MSAKHAVLGLLIDRPAHPYQLASRLEQRLGPAWQVNSGQLYQLVKRLEREGLIERVHSTPGERDDRHVYSITQQGLSEFEHWFDHSSGNVRLCRRPLLVKVTLAGQQRLREALTKVEAYEQECTQRLREITRMRAALPSDGPLVHADHLLLRLNLSADVFQLEGELRWASHAREVLSWLSIREGQAPLQEGDGQPSSASSRARKELFKRIAEHETEGGSRNG